MKTKTVCSFTVRWDGIWLRVRLVATLQDVWRIWGIDSLRHVPQSKRPRSFFSPTLCPSSKHWGTIVLLQSPRLHAHIPHEVVHAVFSYFDREVQSDHDEEEFAYAIGALSEKIFKKLKPYLS